VPLQIHPSLFNPALLWADLAMKATEMMVSSAEVIGNRVDQMARAGANPSPRDMREMVLMGSEKVKAATDSGIAVAARLQSQNMQIFTRAWQQWLTSLGAMAALTSSRTFGEVLSRQNTLFNALSRSNRTHAEISSNTARLAHAAMKPVHAASTANAKRLRRAKKTRTARR
jgi:hypothetical protein